MECPLSISQTKESLFEKIPPCCAAGWNFSCRNHGILLNGAMHLSFIDIALCFRKKVRKTAQTNFTQS